MRLSRRAHLNLHVLNMWILTLLLLLISVHMSHGQSDNSTNCTLPLDWNNVNTTNYTELDLIFEQCMETVSQYEECPDPGLCESTRSENENVGLAFGLTIAAGLATTVGSLIPFIPCIKRADTKYLAASLALAAGVMLYVSFTEIFIKSQYQFCCVSTVHYNLLTTVCFFVGIALTVVLDILVKLLEKVDFNCCKWSFRNLRSIHLGNAVMLEATPSLTPSCNALQAVSPLTSNGGIVQLEGTNSTEHYTSNIDEDVNTYPQLSSITNEPSLTDRNEFIMDNEGMAYTPNIERASISAASNTISATTNNLGDASIQDLLSNTSIHRLHAVLASESVSVMNEDQSHISISLNEDGMSVRTQSLPNGGGNGGGGDTQSRVSTQQPRRDSDNEIEEDDGDHTHPQPSLQEQREETVPPDEPEESTGNVDTSDQLKEIANVLHGKDTKRLRRMGVLTGLAIALHNFPEGLATFIATLSDPSLGAALAIAIALHNIPEGVCVAMPIYYATGSRLKAFFWAFLSGVSEPVGALLGWIVLRNFFGPMIYGISFGIIGGMMVYISLKELLPTAHKFDKTNGILVTLFLVVGMVVMALSLILFAY